MRAFIFDMDGTLADTVLDHPLAWDALFTEMGVSMDRDDFFSVLGRTHLPQNPAAIARR